jgi:hypothetical protein
MLIFKIYFLQGKGAGQNGGVKEVRGEDAACFVMIIINLAALQCSDRHPSILLAMCLCEGLCYEMEQLQSFPFADYSNSNGSL